MDMINKFIKSNFSHISSLHQHARFIEIRYLSPQPYLVSPNEKYISDSSILDAYEIPFKNSLKLIPYYSGLTDMSVLIRDMLIQIGSELSFISYAGGNKDSVYFADMGLSQYNLEEAAERIVHYFQAYLKCPLTFRFVSPNVATECLTERLELAERFYLAELGNWLISFLPLLEDDLSRISFYTYLRQRIRAKIFSNSDICYPVKPPSVTSRWRKEREAMIHHYPELYDIDGNKLDLHHYKLVYDYQQYKIPGKVSPNSGDTVIDAGGFIGDTAAWFAAHVGPKGKVFSFEPSLKNACQGQENMKLNGIQNVTFFPVALSDHTGMAQIIENSSSSSASCITSVPAEEANASPIRVTTLDSACETLGKIDFIKADIEGSEMAFLRGARATITANAPACAICLYHKRDDFWCIPQYLLELRPDYKMWFRCEAEPVLFVKSEAHKRA